MRSHNVAVRKRTGPYGLGESNAPPFMKPRGQATWALCAAPLPNHAGPRGLGAVRRSAAKPCGAERPGRALRRSAAKSCGAERPGRCAPLRCQSTRGREAWARCAPLRCQTMRGREAWARCAPLRCQIMRGREAWALCAAPLPNHAGPRGLGALCAAPLPNHEGRTSARLGSSATIGGCPHLGRPVSRLAERRVGRRRRRTLLRARLRRAGGCGRVEFAGEHEWPRRASRCGARRSWELARESPVFGRTGGVREAWADRKGDGDPDAYESAGCTMVAAWS
jgi:hypothetical protein